MPLGAVSDNRNVTLADACLEDHAMTVAWELTGNYKIIYHKVYNSMVHLKYRWIFVSRFKVVRCRCSVLDITFSNMPNNTKILRKFCFSFGIYPLSGYVRCHIHMRVHIENLKLSSYGWLQQCNIACNGMSWDKCNPTSCSVVTTKRCNDDNRITCRRIESSKRPNMCCT